MEIVTMNKNKIYSVKDTTKKDITNTDQIILFYHTHLFTI